jgi:hypothetical protein
MNALERRYRRLLRAYPAGYRQARGEEILGTLLEVAPPGRSWPLPREARAVIMNGLRARARHNRRLGLAADLRLCALLGLALALGTNAALLSGNVIAHGIRSSYFRWPSPSTYWYDGLAGLAIVAAVTMIWFARRRVSVAAVAAAATVAALPFAAALAGLPWWPGAPVGLDGSFLLAILAVLAAFSPRPPRSWLWLIGAEVAYSVMYAALMPPLPGLPGLSWASYLPLSIVIVVALWAVTDARPAVALAVAIVIVEIPGAAFDLQAGFTQVRQFDVPLAEIAVLVVAAGIRRLRRHAAL